MDAVPRETRSVVLLLIEDDPVQLMYISRGIEKIGHTTVKAENAQEAIRLYKEHRCELALMDVRKDHYSPH